MNYGETCGSEIGLCLYTCIKHALFAVMHGMKVKICSEFQFFSIAFKCNMWVCGYSEEPSVDPSQIRMEIMERYTVLLTIMVDGEQDTVMSSICCTINCT